MTEARPKPSSGMVPLSPQHTSIPIAELLAGQRRLDAEVYLSDGFLVRRTIEQSASNVMRLGELGRMWQPSRLKGIKVEPEHGVPFLAATQVFDVWPTPRKWLASGKTPDVATRYVDPDWIVVTCSGSVGNAIITYSAHEGLIISHDLIRVQIEDPAVRSFVYAFLRTRFGRAMMKATHYGNVIKHLEVAHLEQIPMPVVESLSDEIHASISRACAARAEAYELDLRARQRFSEAMKNRPDLPLEKGYAIPASEIFGGRRRLDAAAHSPGSRFVAQLYELNATSVQQLGGIARVFLPNRFTRIYGDQGLPYLDSEPVFKINPGISKWLTQATDIDPNTYTVQRGWLLMARSGQTYGINGQAILANEWHEGKIISEHVIRIVPDADLIGPGYLQTVLSHPTFGQPLVVSRAFGTSVPELAVRDIEKLPIPRLKRNIEEEIDDAAQKASSLRVAADTWENLAVLRLERHLNTVLGIEEAYSSPPGILYERSMSYAGQVAERLNIKDEYGEGQSES